MTRHRNLLRRLVGLAAVFHVVINIALTCLLLYVSQLNYPGGVALHRLHSIESKSLGVVLIGFASVASILLSSVDVFWYSI